MDKPRPCGCKGRRTCLLCERHFQLETTPPPALSRTDAYIYCPDCNEAFPGWSPADNPHPHHSGDPLRFPGILVVPEFLTADEETRVLSGLEKIPWVPSQSGRRKQNFGPKCNFKKRKLKLGDFRGFPSVTAFVQDKFESVPMLKGYRTIEQCSLEYDPDRGASIDPHVDDCWIWGERVVTVNLLSDSVLTMTYNDKPDRYNLDCVKDYPAVLNSDGTFNSNSDRCYGISVINDERYPIVRVPMPARSLLVMYGEARYDWEHRILREDIVKRRVCLCYREFTPPYLEGGEKYEEGEGILGRAKEFWEIKC